MSAVRERTRRRHRLLADVLRDVDRRGLGALVAWDEPIKDEYGEEGLAGLLLDVWSRWQRTFDARLDGVLEDGGSADLQQSVTEVWQTTAADLGASRLLLDAHAGDPALARAQERHRRLLEVATGVDLAALQAQEYESAQSKGASHGREHRAKRGRLRVRPVCARLHRRSVSAA